MLGITFSAPEDLKKWGDEHGLPMHLLHDADRSVAMAYGAAESADQEKPSRISVLIGPDGKVLKAYPEPNASEHPEEVLKDLG